MTAALILAAPFVFVAAMLGYYYFVCWLWSRRALRCRAANYGWTFPRWTTNRTMRRRLTEFLSRRASPGSSAHLQSEAARILCISPDRVKVSSPYPGMVRVTLDWGTCWERELLHRELLELLPVGLALEVVDGEGPC